MTAYGVVEKSIAGKTFKVHLKTVNHRFLELRCRMPKTWIPFEVDAKNIFQKKLERGSLDLWVEESKASTSTREATKVKDFFTKLSAAVAESEGVAKFFMPSPVRALILARFPDLWLFEASADEQVISKEEFAEVANSLADIVDQVRCYEGKQIQAALLGYAKEIEKDRDQIAQQYPELRKEWEQNYKDRLQKTAEDLKAGNIPEERMLQEILVLAEKRDVAEELSRIAGHLTSLRTLLESPAVENIGKRLEFLLQELHREWTTLGNKIQNFSISKAVVEAKLSLEKIREQALNLV